MIQLKKRVELKINMMKYLKEDTVSLANETIPSKIFLKYSFGYTKHVVVHIRFKKMSFLKAISSYSVERPWVENWVGLGLGLTKTS